MLETVLLQATPAGDGEFDIFTNIAETQGVVLAVLLVLVAMSLACWFIIVYKWLWFARIGTASRRFSARYLQTENPGDLYKALAQVPDSPEERIFAAGYQELGRLSKRQGGGRLQTGFENIERAVSQAQADELDRLERLVPFLATTGSAAPFIGLFGTVWGIMRAFAGIGSMDPDANLLNTVTPHIAEALVATAIGLLAAIPAVMAYNYFVGRVRRASTQMEGFGSDYLNLIRRLYFSS